MTLEQWSDKIDAFLKFNEQELLTHAGKVKAEVAKKIAEDRYDAFDKQRKTAEARTMDEEDFRELEQLEKRLLLSEMRYKSLKRKLDEQRET